MNLRIDDFARQGHPVSEKFDADTTSKIYGMVENIDDNVGRVLAALDNLELAEHTAVIFLTDNGPQQARYNAGMLRLKGTVNEGGIRVPFFVRWRGRFEAGRIVDRIAAHKELPAGAATASVPDVRLPRGAGTLESYVSQGDRRVGMIDVVVSRRR